MPLRVTCPCGQSLNIPDHLAGKTVKCPKCQKGLRVPGGSEGATKPAAAGSGSKAASGGKSSGPAAPDAMAGLFDQAGLVQRTGTFCPSCDNPLAPGTAICVRCGFDLEKGAKVEGFQVERKEFGNRRLVEASEMMKREAETEKRLLGAGMPWWMMLGLLAGLLVMIGAVLVKLDATTSGTQSTIPLFRSLQNAALLPVLALSFGLAMILISNLAQLAILVTAFKESWKQGLLCFIPFYIVYYMFSRMQSKRLASTIIILFVTAILGGIALGYAAPRIPAL